MEKKIVVVPSDIIQYVNANPRINRSFMNNEFEERAEMVRELFISKSNVEYVTVRIYNKFHNKLLRTREMNARIHEDMLNYISVTLDSELFVTNVIEMLDIINRRFITEFGQKNESNEFMELEDEKQKQIASIGKLYNPYNSSIDGPGSEMADDGIPSEFYSKLNMYNNTIVYRTDSQFRYNNRIPFWQVTPHHRPIDRDNSEGLRNYGDRENITMKFNMDHVRKGPNQDPFSMSFNSDAFNAIDSSVMSGFIFGKKS